MTHKEILDAIDWLKAKRSFDANTEDGRSNSSALVALGYMKYMTAHTCTDCVYDEVNPIRKPCRDCFRLVRPDRFKEKEV